jgi:hypothetical protein
MAGPSDTVGSPWQPHAVRLWAEVIWFGWWVRMRWLVEEVGVDGGAREVGKGRQELSMSDSKE